MHDLALRTRNILSLCAGVGGLELGILLALHSRSEAGRGVCYVEREAAAAASLVASMESGWLHPAPVWSDMLTFDARPWRGVVHILASGDPCQDNSVAGKRAGAAGARFLAPEVCRLAEECRPDLIFRENVPGNADGQLEAIAPPLERLGYRVAAGIFSSVETGNSMRRERLFIMAERVNAGSSRAGIRAEHRRIGEQLGVVRGAAVGSPLGCGDGRDASDTGRQAFGRIAPDRAGSASIGQLEQPEGIGPGEGGTEHAGQQGGCPPSGPSDELADTSSARSQGQQRGQHHTAGRQVQSRHAGLSGRAILPPAVIPGPTDSRWIDVLDRWPELQPALSQEEAESHLRRGVDAMAHRVERLRATGNGVDPVTAAYAYLHLQERLRECQNSELVSIAA